MANPNEELPRPEKNPQPSRPLPGTPIAPPERSSGKTLGRQARDLSTVELIKEITAEVGQLAQKQIELAKTELRADLKAEAVTVGGLGMAALAGLAAINLLLVTAIFALATVMPGWAAGLVVTGAVGVFAAIIGLVAWNRRVRSPMARTRRTMKDDVKMTKELV